MAAPLPLILLPPSEGKAGGGGGPPWSPGTMRFDLDDERQRVAAALATAMRGSQAKRAALLGVKGAALAAATEADRDVRTAGTLPAIARYTGVLYDALDAPSLSATQRRRLSSSVVMFSGLWGLVAPDDPIPDYKLKMGARLGRLGRLSSWWRPAITGEIERAAVGRDVWNLLPQEHAAAWQVPVDRATMSVRFLDERPDGSLVAVSHWNKLLKGALVRFLLDSPGARSTELEQWQHPLGYRLEPTLTTTDRGVTVFSLVKQSGQLLS